MCEKKIEFTIDGKDEMIAEEILAKLKQTARKLGEHYGVVVFYEEQEAEKEAKTVYAGAPEGDAS